MNQFTNLSQESKQAFATVLKRQEHRKGYSLLRPGAVCHHFYFIEEGLTRTYYIKDGNDVTDWLSAENSIAVSTVCFLTRKPDVRGIELLEPSVLWAISYQDMEDLYKKYHDIE